MSTQSLEVGKPFNPYRMFHGSFVPNWLMPITDLTPGAKLCYARLAQYSGKNGSCYPTLDALALALGVGGRQVARYIKELSQCGLLGYVKNKFGASNRYIFLWHRWMQEEDEADSQSRHICHDRNGSNVDINVASIQTDMSVLEAPSIYTLKDSVQKTHVPQVLSDKERLEKESTEIYQVYPRKEARPAALKAIAKALKTVPFSELLAKTKLFAEAWTGAPKADLVYCPHPATWFNNERYNGDPELWKRSTPRVNLGSLPMQIKAIEEDIDRHPCNPDNRDDFTPISPELKAKYKQLTSKLAALREQRTQAILAA